MISSGKITRLEIAIGDEETNEITKGWLDRSLSEISWTTENK